MARVVGGVFSAAAGSLALFVGGRVVEYQRARRKECEDEYPLLNFGEAFIVSTLFRIRGIDDTRGAADAYAEALLRDGAELKRAIQAAGGTVIYAGRVALYGAVSKQADVCPHDWHGVMLHQWADQNAFAAARAKSDGLARALAHAGLFERAYSCGMRSSMAVSSVSSAQFGILSSLVRLQALARGHAPATPLRRLSEADLNRVRNAPQASQASRLMDEVAADVERFGDEDGKRLCILNLIKKGSAKQQGSDSTYMMRMMEMFAEVNAGLLHLGSAVKIDEDTTAEWDQVALVSYPSKRFFDDLIHSEWMMGSSSSGPGVGAGKSLGDSIALGTVPILSKL